MSVIPTIAMVLFTIALGCVLLAFLSAIVAERKDSVVADIITGWLLFAALAVVMLALFLVVLYLGFGRLP